MYDLTVTAACRPRLVDRCLAAFKRHVTPGPERVLVNIDPAGDGSRQIDVQQVVLGYFPDAVFRMPDKPSFPLAVKWLWENATSPHIFHLEDSKEMAHDVELIPLLTAGLAAISLKFFNPEWQYYPPRPKERGDGLIETDYYDKAVCMQPTLWRTDVARGLAGWMKNGVSPEKTIRCGHMNPDREAVIEYMRQFRFGFVTEKNGVFWYHRHGATWRRRNGFKKRYDGIPVTWVR